MESNKLIDLEDENENFDLSFFFNFIIRNKYFITIFTFIFSLFSAFYATSRPRIWGGQFEIVLENKLQGDSILSSYLNDNPGFSNFVGGLGLSPSKQLKTEVEILKSPSVLMPVFEFVKENKKNKTKNINLWRYNNWIEENLKVQLSKGTSILKVSYRSDEKEIILPVLNKISNTYQQYSGRNKIESLNNSLTYLKKQIDIYTIKNKTSSDKLLKFSLKNDITNKILEARNIAANKIRVIDNQINSLNNSNGDLEKQRYLIEIFSKNNLNLSKKINDLEKEFYKVNSIYTQDSEIYKNFQEYRKDLISKFKYETLAFLNAEKMNAKSILAASERSTDTLIKYNDLESTALKDAKTLKALESTERALTLEREKIRQPWELITKPTLLINPIAPSRRRITMAGAFLSFLISLFFANLKEKRSGLIYDLREIKKLFKYPLIAQIKVFNSKNLNELINIIFNGKLKKIIGKKIAITSIGQCNKDLLKQFIDKLKENSGDYQVIIIKELIQANTCDSLLVLAQVGKLSKNDLLNFRGKMDYLDIPILGWINLIQEAKSDQIDAL